MSNKADYTALAGRTQGYALQVKRLFDEAVKELLDIAKAAKTGQAFSFDQTKTMADRAQKALRKLHAAVTTAIERGIQLEWGRADKAADELVASVFGRQALKDKRYSTMLMRNDKALNSFMRRADNGMNLSKRVWQSCESLQKEMELAISVSVGEGVSADTMSRRVRQYLNEPNKLFRRVRKGTDADGNPIYGLSKAAAAYHPGRGVYRSSYKNAMRLARTETNMAYRTEDCSRMSKLDFVLGVRINLSKNHPEKDICDELAGDYPKTFKFTGWHPQCRCYMTSILPSAEELKAYNKALLNGENYSFRGQIREYPAAFKDWVRDNAEKIENGSNVPYFVSDNQAAIDRILGNEPSIEERAEQRHKERTPEEAKAIKEAWAERNHKRAVVKKGANNVLKVAQDWPEVDYSALQAAVDSGDYMKMKEAAKQVSQQIVAMRKQENALSDIIPEVHQWHKQFTIKQLTETHDAVAKTLANKVEGNTLNEQKDQLEFEIKYASDPYFAKLHTLYPTSKVAVSAYNKKLVEVQDEIYWKDVTNQFNQKAAFVTTSKNYKDLLTQLGDAIVAEDKAGAQKALMMLDAKRAELEKGRKKDWKPVDYKELTDAAKSKAMNSYKNNTVKETDTKLRPITEEQWKQLSEDEKKVLSKYTETYSYLNEPLRNIPYGGLRDKEEFDKDMPLLTKALSKCKTRQDMVVCRFTNDFYIPELGKNFSQLQVGDVYTDGAFLSTAAHESKGLHRSYRMRIYVPKGAMGVFAEPFSHYNMKGYSYQNNLWDGVEVADIGGEFEVLLQRGCRMRVVEIGGGIITLELIGQLYTQQP